MKLGNHPVWNALNNPLISMSLAIYSASMLLLASHWYVRFSSILFIPFILEGIFRYICTRPKISANRIAGIIHIFLSLIIATTVIEELLLFNDPPTLQIIASTICIIAIIILLSIGIIEIKGTNRNSQ